MNLWQRHKTKVILASWFIIPALVVVFIAVLTGGDEKNNAPTPQAPKPTPTRPDPDIPNPSVDVNKPLNLDLPDLPNLEVEKTAITQRSFADVKWKDSAQIARSAVIASQVYTTNSVQTWEEGYARIEPFLAEGVKKQVRFELYPFEDTALTPPRYELKSVQARQDPVAGDRIVTVAGFLYVEEKNQPLRVSRFNLDVYFLPDDPLIARVHMFIAE